MQRGTRTRLVLLALAVLGLYAFRLEHTPPHLHRDEVMFGDDPMMAAYWRFALLKYRRADLLPLTQYVDARSLDFTKVPAHALILMTRNDAPLVALIASGQLRELAEIPEPADPPRYIVAER
jgi:hypothetical protein